MIPGSGRSPGEENGNPLQYSCLGNPMDRGTWEATVHQVTKESDMTLQLNDNKNSEYRKHTWGFTADKQSEEVSSKWRGSKRRHYGQGDSC